MQSPSKYGIGAPRQLAATTAAQPLSYRKERTRNLLGLNLSYLLYLAPKLLLFSYYLLGSRCTPSTGCTSKISVQTTYLSPSLGSDLMAELRLSTSTLMVANVACSKQISRLGRAGLYGCRCSRRIVKPSRALSGAKLICFKSLLRKAFVGPPSFKAIAPRSTTQPGFRSSL